MAALDCAQTRILNLGIGTGPVAAAVPGPALPLLGTGPEAATLSLPCDAPSQGSCLAAVTGVEEEEGGVGPSVGGPFGTALGSGCWALGFRGV